MHRLAETVDKLIAAQEFSEALRLLDTHCASGIQDLDLTVCRARAMAGLERWSDVVDIGLDSIDSAREDASRLALAQLHCLVGTGMFRLGRLGFSEPHLRAAAHIYTWDLKSPSLALMPIRILSVSFINLGMWSTARHELSRAIELADRLNAKKESVGLRINLAIVLQKSAAIDTAIRPIEEAYELAQSEGLALQQILCRLVISRRLKIVGDFSNARRMLSDLLVDLDQRHMPREKAICLEYLGDCHLAQREYRKALDQYQAGMKIAEETAPRGDLVPELCHRMAEAHIHLGDPNQAILLCDRGLRLARELNDRYEECATHRVLAMAHRAAGNPSKAHRLILEGIELGRSYEIPYELARALAWAGETRMQSKGRDDQMLGRLQLWEARAVFERIGLSNEVRHLDKVLGFEDELQEAPETIASETLANVPNLDRGAFRFGIITTSFEVGEAVATIQSVAPSKIPVLITGPSGVGKELLAHALHRMSDRRKMPFLPVNCGAISASLIESELFGHERGAFTGAVATRDGLFTAADKGTIFLDEIGELPMSTQATLLRVLERGELRRLGSDDVRTIDVRVVAATNADLEELVARGVFRKDLFFRLEGVNVKVPPLCEREEDIRVLFRYFLAEASVASKKKITVTDEVEPLLCAYGWPGNVRELKNEVARAVAMAEDGAVLGKDAFLPKLRKKSPAALREARQRDEANADERGRILEALRAHRGNKADAARSLGGMKRTTLLYKMERLQIRPEEYQVKEQ